jgi:hypothetical protein
MTTPEAPAEVGRFQISVCGTCDVVFRVHAGRPSCPVCGGDPNQVLLEGTITDLSPDSLLLDEEKLAPATEAPAEEPPPTEEKPKRSSSRRKDI